MADIVPTLFGLTPEAYQQQQAAAADRMALEYAKLDPLQQAQFAIGRGAYQLAGALGGALGAQDPQLQLISRRNAIAKQINYGDLGSIQQGIQQLSGFDPVGAMQLAEVGRKLESEMAQTFQRTAAGRASLAQALREQKQAIPADIAKAQEIGRLTTALQTPDLSDLERASLEAQLASLRPEAKEKPSAAQLQLASEIANQKQIVDTLRNQPASPERDATLNRATYTLEALERQLPQPKAGPLAKEIGVAKDTGAPVLLDEQGLFIYKNIDGKQVRTPFSGAIESKTPKTEVKNVMPGDKTLGDIPAFRASVQRTIEPQLKTITATQQALTAINDSLATGNFAAYRAAQVQFARAIAGAGDLSQKELKAAGADPSLLGGTADYLFTVFSGTPTTDTQQKLRNTLQAIQTVARKQALGEVNQQRKIALRSPGYNADAVNEALDFPQLKERPAPTGKTGNPLIDKYLSPGS